MSEEITPEIARQWLRGDQPLNVAPAAIVRAYLEKCEQEKEDIASFKACMRQDFKEKSQLRNENKKLMAQLDVAASHLTHAINNNAAIREENARLQGIVERQRQEIKMGNQLLLVARDIIDRKDEALPLTATEIPNSILEQFMVCAFRYACTRRSPNLSEMLNMIEPYWSCLSPTFQRQIKYDIQDIIDRDAIESDEIPRIRRILAL